MRFGHGHRHPAATAAAQRFAAEEARVVPRGDARDRGYRKRLCAALGAALALHVVIAALPSRREPAQPETIVAARRVTIVQRTPPPAAPSPRPSITPTPHHAPARAIVAPAPAAAAVSATHERIGGAAAPRRAAAAIHTPRFAPPVSVAAGTHAGVANGGAGTGAGPGAGDSGLAGTGMGTGTHGTGNGGDANEAPCGDVFFLPGSLAFRNDGTVVQQVLVKIVERDGTVIVERFPYPFLYAAERLNPFAHDEAVTAADGGIPVQEPPPGDDPATMPPAVQLVLKHTNPQTGYTDLPACNPRAASPAP